jgi:hypothetical protein
MREERAASASAPIRLRPESTWRRHRGRFMEANALRGCGRVAAVGAGASAAGRREGGRCATVDESRRDRNSPLRTKQVWPTFHREGCGRDDAERAPGARDRRCPVIPARPLARRKQATGAPVDPWQPRAGRGAVPWARCRKGPNLKNLFDRSGTISGSPVQWSTQRGVVVQSVRMLACHAGGRGFESRPLRQLSRKARESGLSAFPETAAGVLDEWARAVRPGCGEPPRSAVNCAATEIEPRIDAAKTPR